MTPQEFNLDSIADTSKKNLNRAKNFVQIYTTLSANQVTNKKPGKKAGGRAPVKDTDLLRAAVVFLHSAVEEVFRGLAMLAWPKSNKEFLDSIPFAWQTKNPIKVGLGSFSTVNGHVDPGILSIEDLIRESIKSYVYGSYTINRLSDINDAINNAGLARANININGRYMTEFLKRRHDIVHHGDRRDATIQGSGNHGVKSLSLATVKIWVTEVEAVLTAVLADARRVGL